LIRPEREVDLEAVREVNAGAFGRPDEARLVDALRGRASRFQSTVALLYEEIVGNIVFTPIRVDDDEGGVMGLAPMAVRPQVQRRGIGSALVRAGLERCRSAGAVAVVVLGHPEYYPRFGFVPAARFGLRCEYEVPEEAFMALELQPGALAGLRGTVRYHPAFAQP
jgi:putative acetyltransferase